MAMSDTLCLFPGMTNGFLFNIIFAAEGKIYIGDVVYEKKPRIQWKFSELGPISRLRFYELYYRHNTLEILVNRLH